MNKKILDDFKEIGSTLFQPEKDIALGISSKSRDYARKLQFSITVLIWLVPFTILPTWLALLGYRWTDSSSFFYNLADRFIPYSGGVIALSQVHWTPLAWTVGLLSELIGAMPFWLGLFSLLRVFQNYEKGQVFSVENTQHYSWLGRLCIINAFVQPIAQSLLILGVTLSNPVGARVFSIGAGSISLISLFIGYILYFIAMTMQDALKMQNELTLTV